MEVTSSNANGLSGIAVLWEQNQRQTQATQEDTIKQEDSVRVSHFPQNATLLSDAESEVVLQETMDSIKSDPYEAMFVHSGLDASRVAALLA